MFFIFFMDGGCHPNMDVCISEGIAEEMETKNNENEVACRNIHQSDPCIIETEPSPDNRSHFNLTFSFSESDSEERSEASVHDVSIEVPSPLRRQSLDYGTELHKSVASYHKSSRSDGHQNLSDDGKNYSIHVSPMRYKPNHERWRHRHFVKPRILLESDDGTYPVSDAESDYKRYRRHRYPVEEEWKHHRGRPHGVTDWKIYPENCNEASLLSNAQEISYKDYSFVYCGRRVERQQDLGYHERKGSSYYREKRPCGNSSKRADIDKEDDMDGFWYHGQRLPAQQGSVPCTYKESGRSWPMKGEDEHERHTYSRSLALVTGLMEEGGVKLYRGEHEQKVLMDRESVNLIVGEGKSSGRHSDGRSLICNARLEKMGLEFPMERKSLRDFNDCCGSKAVKTDIPKTNGIRNNEKQLGKFSVTKNNQDLDIEEGQIICEERSIECINPEKENASETMIKRGKVKMRTLHVDNASDKNRAVGKYDNKRILETLARMEKTLTNEGNGLRIPSQ
ncbi:hypothetical protein REPUB_Repub20aG0138800 [Reevesia pubescens]